MQNPLVNTRRSVLAARLIVAAAACLTLLPTEARAIQRYTSTSMTCAEIKATLGRDGAAIMRHQSPRTGILLYDRYVKNRSFCPVGQTTERAYIPSADRKSCPVDRCKEIEFFDMR
jgi:hypothetical protein